MFGDIYTDESRAQLGGSGTSRSPSSPPEPRNFARERFTVRSDRARIGSWPVIVENRERSDLAAVSDLRRATGRFPHDVRPAELVRVLIAGNPAFAGLRASGTVAAHREDRKAVKHPEVGDVRVDCDVLTDGDSDLKIVILSALPGSSDEEKSRLAMAAAAIDGAPAPAF